MVTGTLPGEEDMVATLNRFAERLKGIAWSVKPQEVPQAQ
jgi:hypothetical protein